MGTIPGPIVTFRFDETGFITAAQAALSKVSQQVAAQNKQNAQSVVSSIADPLAAQAAKLRALYSTGTLGIKALQVEQQKLVGQLDVEISKLTQRNALTTRELATLKQLTLERERQQNAINRGVGVGVTAGTQSALGLVSQPIVANISRLGAGLIGVAGGSGLETTAFGAAAGGIAAISSVGGPAIAVIGALTVSLLAAGGAAAALAISGGKVVENFSLISQKTGISIANLQVLDAVGKTVNVSLDDVVIGFRKLSAAITGGNDIDENGVVGATKKGSELLKTLGITSKDSFVVIQQLAGAFTKLPDGAVKAQVAVQLLGRSGLNLIAAFNAAGGNVEKFKQIVAEFGPVIGKDGVEAQAKYKLATVELDLAFQKLQISATPLLGVLTKLTDQTAKFVSHLSDGSAIKDFIKALAPFTGIGEIAANAAIDFGVLDGAAKKTGSSLNAGFSAGEEALKKLSPLLKKIKGDLDGSAEALKKMIEEGRKELQKLDEEEGKSALEKINAIGKQSDVSGLDPTEKVLAEQQQKLQEIAELMLKFPQFANEARGAVASLTKATIGELEKLADEALKKQTEKDDTAQNERIKRENELKKLITGVDDDLAIARAQATKNGVAAIIAEEQKRLDDTRAKAIELGATEQQLADIKLKIEQEAQAKIAKLRQEDIKKTRDEVKAEAGRLFDALLSGSKNFGEAIKKLLLGVALTPVKLVFEAIVTAIFAPIVQKTKDALKGLGEELKKKGGILQKIGEVLSPTDKNQDATLKNTTATDANTDAINNLTSTLGGTPATRAGAVPNNLPLGNIGLGGLGSPVNFGLPGGGSGTGSSGGGLGSISGQASALSNLGGIGKLLLPFILGGTNIAQGLITHNTAQAVGGGLTVAGGVLSSINKDPNSSLNKLGSIIGGAGLVISGVSQGGLKGAGEAALGGAEIGTAILPGIGTAIGAAAGFGAALIRSLFGPSKQERIQRAIKRQFIDPSRFIGQEFDSTFGQTLADSLHSTSKPLPDPAPTPAPTFSTGPGGVFSAANIRRPSSGAATHVSFNINAIDGKNVADFLNAHGSKIAATVGSKINSSNNGLANSIRTAVSPA